MLTITNIQTVETIGTFEIIEKVKTA